MPYSFTEWINLRRQLPQTKLLMGLLYWNHLDSCLYFLPTTDEWHPELSIIMYLLPSAWMKPEGIRLGVWLKAKAINGYKSKGNKCKYIYIFESAKSHITLYTRAYHATNNSKHVDAVWSGSPVHSHCHSQHKHYAVLLCTCASTTRVNLGVKPDKQTKLCSCKLRRSWDCLCAFCTMCPTSTTGASARDNQWLSGAYGRQAQWVSSASFPWLCTCYCQAQPPLARKKNQKNLGRSCAIHSQWFNQSIHR